MSSVQHHNSTSYNTAASATCARSRDMHSAASVLADAVLGMLQIETGVHCCTSILYIQAG